MSGSAAIEILSSGGMAGGGAGNVRIWEDGTVLFDGPGCAKGSRRGRMSPARVHAVIDTLVAAQFFTWSHDEVGSCADAFITALTVHRGRSTNTVVDRGCHSPKHDRAAQAIDLVMQAVGKNACSPECGGIPDDAFCN